MSQSTEQPFDEISAGTGVVKGQPLLFLRLEAAIALGIAVMLYAHGGYSWVLFAILFFTPDITFGGYVAGPVIGSVCYNLAHSYFSPAILAMVLHLLGDSIAIPLIWVAHIAMDRGVGYGLKYPDAFGHTHLAELGKTTPK